MPPSPAEMRDRYRAIAWRYRNLPGLHGLRVHTVEIGISTWGTDHTGDGSPSTTWTTIAEASGICPKVRVLNDEEIAVSDVPGGSIEIGPITPAFSGGGTDLVALLGAVDTGDARFVRVTLPESTEGTIYTVKQFHTDKALHHTIVAVPVSAA